MPNRQACGPPARLVVESPASLLQNPTSRVCRVTRTPRMKPEKARCLLDVNHLEPGCFHASGESVRVDRNKRVAKMNEPHERAGQTIAACQFAPGTQNSFHLAEHRILQLRGRHMVQHGECCASGKNCVLKRHRCRVAGHHRNVGAAHPQPQRLCQLWVGFDGREPWNPRTKEVGCETWTRTNF